MQPIVPGLGLVIQIPAYVQIRVLFVSLGLNSFETGSQHSLIDGCTCQLGYFARIG